MKKSGLYRASINGALILVGVCATAFGATAEELKASLADSAWTGESVPEGQQCQRFGGTDPKSPTVRLENIPAGADAIILEFSDRSFARMDKGGHGIVGYKLSGENKDAVTIPSVPAHTEELPEGFFVVQAHRAPGWDKAGAYLPPCSGGRGNDYFIDIKAVELKDDNKVEETLGEASIKMAKY